MPSDRQSDEPSAQDEHISEVFVLIRRARAEDIEFAKLVELARQLAEPAAPEMPQPTWDHPLTIEMLKLGPGTTRAAVG